MTVIGVPREVKDGELRVALTPSVVRTLVDAGHRVRVEQGAGVGAGCSDSDFYAAGAALSDVEEVWSSTLVVKVKEPQPGEFRLLRPDLTLFAFLHLAAKPKLAAALCSSGARAYAFEDLRVDGKLPILAPMSQVAGRIAGLVGPNLLSTAAGGRGVLAGGVDGAPAARAVVVGVGVAGEAAAASLRALGMRVAGIDPDERKLSRLIAIGLLASGALPGSAEAAAEVDAADLAVATF